MVRLVVILIAGALTIASGQQMNEYAGLMRLIFPDFAIDKDDPSRADVSSWVPVRRLDGDGLARWEDSMAVDRVEAVAVKVGSSSQLLLQFRADADGVQPERTVALFQLKPVPKLLDVGTISAYPDDFGSLAKSQFALNATTDIFETVTDHSNSQQGYEGRRFFFVDGGRVKMIYDVELLNGRCVGGENFDEKLSVSVAPDPGRPYNKVKMQIALEMLPDTECPDGHRGRKSTRIFSGVFRWDAERREFLTSSKELAELEAFNEKRR